MTRDEGQRIKGDMKRTGQFAAKRWCRSALPKAQIALAGWRFEYGMTLNDLVSEGADVPPSGNRDYSWGFFKQVKGRIYHAACRSRVMAAERTAAAAPKHILVSYSHSDRPWLDRLKTHLRPLMRGGIIDLWDDTRINPGSDWRKEIDQALSKAQLAILIVSADFLASEFICNNELPPLLKRAARGGVRVVSLIVRPCLYMQHSALARYQAANDPRRPLSSLPEHEIESVLMRLAEQINESMS